MKKYRFDEIAFNSTEKKKPTEADKDTYLGLEHLDSGCLTVSRFGSDVAPIGEKLVMKKGDVLFGKRRAYQKKVAIAPFDGIFSAHGMVLRPKCNVIDPDFFPLFISSDYFLDAAIKISVGSLSPTINWRDLKELEFELPDLKEQKCLAGVLNSINRTREAYKKLLFLTDQLVKSQFMEMFGDPNKLENGVELTKAFDIRDDLRKPLNDAVRQDMHSGTLYPYYGANGAVDYINEYMIDGTALCLAEDCGDYGPGAKSSYIIRGKSWVNNHAHVLFPKTDCNILYANMYFCLLDINRYIVGSTRSKLTQEQLRKIPILLPSLEKQERFASLIHQSDKSKFELERAISELDATYKRIISENLG